MIERHFLIDFVAAYVAMPFSDNLPGIPVNGIY